MGARESAAAPIGAADARRSSMSLESVHRLLRVASHLLDQAAAEVRDCGLEQGTEQVHRLGRALVEVIEVQRRLYVVRPDLQPRALTPSRREADANRLFSQIVMEALECEDAGNAPAAIEKYLQFIGLSPSHHHREIVREAIRRLSAPAV